VGLLAGFIEPMRDFEAVERERLNPQKAIELAVLHHAL
jgi:hypothetical protein